MAEQICVCPQCGKKYKLKEGFDAKSFSCKSCGATVWVGGKAPTPAPSPRRSSGAPASRKSSRGAAPSAAKRGAHRSRRAEPEHEEEGGRRGRGREKPKSKANVLMAIGSVALIGIVVVVILMSGKKDKGKTPQQQPVAEQPGGTTETPGLAAAATGTPPAEGTTSQPGTNAAPAKAAPASTATTEPGKKAPAQESRKKPEGEEEAAPSPEGGETPTKLGGDAKKKPDGLGKHDPPATLGHLDSTPPELRKQIDDLIAVLFDPMAGRDCHDAKAKLVAIGKPAFLPILGKMATVRDSITDVDSQPERDMEASLMLADQCLREMDGFLDAQGKQPIRPGTDKNYIAYILRLHYRRWNDGFGSTPLKDLPEMPGAFDPSKLPPDEPEESGK